MKKLHLTKYERFFVSWACRSVGIESPRNSVDFCGKIPIPLGMVVGKLLSALHDCDFLVSPKDEDSPPYGTYKFVYLSDSEYYMLNLSSGTKCFRQKRGIENYRFDLVRSPLYELKWAATGEESCDAMTNLVYIGCLFEDGSIYEKACLSAREKLLEWWYGLPPIKT